MPNRCQVVRCNGNYNEQNKCRVFKLPTLEFDQQLWIAALPPRQDFVINPKTFHICERHWPPGTPMKTTAGGYTRPEDPPSIFPNVPPSCLQTPKAPPRPPKDPNVQLRRFEKIDKITSFKDFAPENELKEKYKNYIISRTDTKFVCVFMTEDFSDCLGTVIVFNKPVIGAPVTVNAFQSGIRVTSLSHILLPCNGLSKYSQFFAVVNCIKNFVPPIETVVGKVATVLESNVSSQCELSQERRKKFNFIIRQLQLLQSKKYNTSDFCFAVEHYPR